MRKKEVLIGAFLTCLLVLSVGFIAYQQNLIQQYESGEIIPFNDNRDWGATIYMRVYRSGVLLSEESYHNVITDAGRSALRGHIADSTVNVWKYMAIGTSTGGGASSTTLENEYSRYAGVYATVGSFNFTLTFTWTAGNFSGQTITEFGVFNDPTTGTILNYDDSFSRGPLTGTDSLQVIANFQVGS